ncbi:MAG: isoaspartyl peptidase/L-asparaginase [Balneolales bacterium]|nr:isoaspartyl peptidase/L-asparaginase [Balneolales bacterium]
MNTIIRNVALLFFVITMYACAPENSQSGEMVVKEYALAIHGGAGVISKDISDEVRDGYLASLEAAVRAGEEMLREGRSALDVVEVVVTMLEDDPRFNAGVGSVYTSEALHELDAAIMDGSDRNAGAVAGLRTVRNPISMARYIMEETPHVFFSGVGAEQLADQTDLVRVENSHFSTENRRNQLERAIQRAALSNENLLENIGESYYAQEYKNPLENSGENENENENDITHEQKPALSNSLATLSETYPEVIFIEDADRFGTVGAVALDRDGNLAAATSTGGMTNKMPGRVGDVPVIGAGTYADNNTAAISATGHGEKFIRNVVAYQITAGMEYEGLSLAEAAHRVINGKLDQGDGGIIAVDRFGNISMTFSSPGMFRGAADSDGHFEVAIWE